MSKICTICNGTGIVEEVFYSCSNNADDNSCDVCNGTGTLEDYEEVCPKCKGKKWNAFEDFKKGKPLFIVCILCNNKRKIDWIDKIKK